MSHISSDFISIEEEAAGSIFEKITPLPGDTVVIVTSGRGTIRSLEDIFA